MNIFNVSYNLDELNRAIANKIYELSEKYIKTNGVFHIALSGGNTPKKLFELLSGSDFSCKLKWDKIHIYVTDERFVHSNSERNNSFILKTLLLDKIKDYKPNFYKIKTDNISPIDSALDYENIIRQNIMVDENNIIKFDLILLGVGADGHVASLFPCVNYSDTDNRLVKDIYVDDKIGQRITLTYTSINHAENIIFLIVGKEKNNITKDIILNYGKKESCLFDKPIGILKLSGNVSWFILSNW